MLTPVAGRFDRIIKKLERYHPAQSALPDWINSLGGPVTDSLGSYRGGLATGPFNENQIIYFFEQGLAFHDCFLQFPIYLNYTDIVSIELPQPDSGSTKLRLKNARGSTSTLDIVGTQNQSRDVFEIGRFLIRVIEDKLQSNA